jgi:hypothetical protein
MRQFRSKPSVIEAEQFHGVGWYEANERPYPEGHCLCDDGKKTSDTPHSHVHTAHEQIVLLSVGDWIVREPDGRGFYPVKPDIFTAKYEPALSPVSPV